MNPISKAILIEAAQKLKPLLEEIAFVGGGILPTYIPKGFDLNTGIYLNSVIYSNVAGSNSLQKG